MNIVEYSTIGNFRVIGAQKKVHCSEILHCVLKKGIYTVIIIYNTVQWNVIE